MQRVHVNAQGVEARDSQELWRGGAAPLSLSEGEEKARVSFLDCWGKIPLYGWAPATCTGVPSMTSSVTLVMSASAPLRPELTSISVP